jgi:MFS family permease
MASKKYCWWVLGASTLAQMCAALSTQGIGVLSGFLQNEFGLSNSLVGLLATMLNFAPIFGLFFAGKLIDRIGEGIPVFMGMIMISLAMLWMSTAHHYWVLIAALFFSGMGYSPVQPGGSKAVYNWFSPQLRGLAMGIRQAAIPLGGAMAALLFPCVIKHYDWRIAVTAGSLIVLTAGGFFFIVCHYAPFAHKIKKTPAFLNENFSIFPSLMSTAVIGIILAGVQTIILTFWILFIKHRFHIPLLAGARYLFALQVSGAIGRIIISTLSTKIKNGYKQAISITMIMMILILGVIISFPENIPAYILMTSACLLGFFSFGWYGPWIVWILEKSPSENKAAVLGKSMALNQIAITFTPLLFGFFVDISGNYQLPWLCLAGIVIIAWIFLNTPLKFKKIIL